MSIIPATNEPGVQTGMANEHLELANDLQELVKLRKWLDDLCTRHDIADKTRFYMELVLEEAVTNIDSYAFASNESHVITIDVSIQPSEVSITLQDDGIEFNPLNREQPARATSIEDAQIGGMGIHLIRSYTRQIEYFREQGKNHLVMVLDR